MAWSRKALGRDHAQEHAHFHEMNDDTIAFFHATKANVDEHGHHPGEIVHEHHEEYLTPRSRAALNMHMEARHETRQTKDLLNTLDTLLNLSEEGNQHHADFLRSGAQINETYFLVGKLRGLHDVGKVGERWFLNISILDGALTKQITTEIKLGPKISNGYRANVGMIGYDGDFRVHLTNLDHRAVRFMRDKLLCLKVLNSDTVLEVKNVSDDLVMDRHLRGPIEFTAKSMQTNQCMRPNAHIFASLYLKSSLEMDTDEIRNSTDTLSWNPESRTFDVVSN